VCFMRRIYQTSYGLRGWIQRSGFLKSQRNEDPGKPLPPSRDGRAIPSILGTSQSVIVDGYLGPC